MNREALTELLVGALISFMSVAFYLLREYIKDRREKTEIRLLPFVIDHLVEFAEQKYGTGKGDEKMEAVVSMAASLLKSVPQDQVEVFAEKSVSNMNKILSLLGQDPEKEGVPCEDVEPYLPSYAALPIYPSTPPSPQEPTTTTG